MKTFRYKIDKKTGKGYSVIVERKLRLKKWVKYLLLVIFDLIVIFNLPIFLINEVNTLNEYRFDMLVLFIFFIINIIIMVMIERRK